MLPSLFLNFSHLSLILKLPQIGVSRYRKIIRLCYYRIGFPSKSFRRTQGSKSREMTENQSGHLPGIEMSGSQGPFDLKTAQLKYFLQLRLFELV